MTLVLLTVFVEATRADRLGLPALRRTPWWGPNAPLGAVTK